jgi:hypothetical protein
MYSTLENVQNKTVWNCLTSVSFSKENLKDMNFGFSFFLTEAKKIRHTIFVVNLLSLIIPVFDVLLDLLSVCTKYKA